VFLKTIEPREVEQPLRIVFCIARLPCQLRQAGAEQEQREAGLVHRMDAPNQCRQFCA